MYEMHGKKFWKKFLVAAVAVGVVNFSPIISYKNNLQIVSVVHAEIKTYEAVGRAEFNFGENNPQLVEMAKNYARMNAVQSAKEQAGIYLKSFSRSLGGNLTDDEVFVVVNGSAEVIDVKYKKLPYISHDVQGNVTGEIGIAYEATAVVKIDSDELSRYIKRDEKEKLKLIEQNKSSQKNIADINKNVEELKSYPQKFTVADIQNIDNKILAQQKNDEGLKFSYQKNHGQAILRFNKSIELNPNYFDAYFNRGFSYVMSENYLQAIEDFSQAIKLNSNYADAYYFRGFSYGMSKNHLQEISDYTQAIKLNTRYYSSAYYLRGLGYYALENYEKAVKDFTKYIQLVPNDEWAYYDRGLCYQALGNTRLLH